MTYVKLHASILDSSVWLEPHATRIVWLTLMAMADRDGLVRARVPGITARARVTPAECSAALDTFRRPDPHSATPDNEGRRIRDTPEGILLLNYELHRDRETAEEKARKHAERQARYRERQKERDAANVTSDARVTPCDRSDQSDTLRSSASHLHLNSDHLRSTQHTDTDCEGVRAPPVAARRKRSPPKDPMGQQVATAAAWDAYRVAYVERYRAEPLRNAKVNGQLASLCKRLPVDSLPWVVSAYVQSQNARYVAAGHPVGLLLADAEVLHTEAITGRRRTQHGAREADRRTGRGDAYREMFEEIRREDAEKANGLNAEAE